MKNYQEIKDIIVNQLGLTDLDAYAKYEELYRPPNNKIITREEVELLSPDNINCIDFWKVIEEVFGVDCITNTMHENQKWTPTDCNRRNLGLARQMGALNVIDWCAQFSSQSSILEIGTGYGCLKHYLEPKYCFNYTGVDVVPRVEGVIQTTPEGLLPDSIKDRKFFIVYSCNVFQHLSTKQRESYINTAWELLEKGGFLIIALTLHPFQLPVSGMAEDGNLYMKHYGQFTAIPSRTDFLSFIRGRYNILTVTQRYTDDYHCLVCQPKDKE